MSCFLSAMPYGDNLGDAGLSQAVLILPCPINTALHSGLKETTDMCGVCTRAYSMFTSLNGYTYKRLCACACRGLG